MGIQGFFPLVKKHSLDSLTVTSQESLKNKTIGVDISTYLHRYYATQGTYLKGLIYQIAKFKRLNITPIYVFDTGYSEMKQQTLDKRKERIKKEEEKEGVDEFEKKKKTFRIKKEDVDFLRKLFDLMNIDYIYPDNEEADIILAQLSNNNLVDGVLSEDADMLIMGVKKLFRNFKSNVVEIVDREQLMSDLSLTNEQIKYLAILSGCDYLPKIKGVGMNTAFKLVKEYSMEEIVKKYEKKITGDYDWKRAYSIFQKSEDKLDYTCKCKKFEYNYDEISKLLLENEVDDDKVISEIKNLVGVEECLF
jgi:exonuclease-1